MADHDAKWGREFLDLLKKLKDARAESRAVDTLVQKIEVFLTALKLSIESSTVKAPAKSKRGATDVNFASCFLDSLTTLTTASSKLVGPILDLTEVLVRKKVIDEKSVCQLSDAIYDVTTSTAWGETVELKYVPTCISLLKASVPNWKYESQAPHVEKKVAMIMRCLWHWSDQTQQGEQIVLPGSCADVCVDVIHKSISWLRDKSMDASGEGTISWTTELVGGAVCALKVPKDETVMDAAILLSYAIMSGCTVATFIQSKAPEVLLHRLLDAVRSGKGLSVIRAIVNAVYLACMKSFPFQVEKLKEVVTALHTCIVDLQDPWLSAMSATLVTWCCTEVLRRLVSYTDAEQSFSETVGQYVIEEFKKCAIIKLPLLQFVWLRLFVVMFHHCHVKTGIGLRKPTENDALDTYTATLTDVVKRISVCVQSLSELGPDTILQLPDVPPIFKGTGWSHAESILVCKNR
eukprot:jgi/Botrbrau1/12753/Bobra.67_1s0112.1